MSALNFRMRPPEERARLKPRARLAPSSLSYSWMVISVAAVSAAVFAAVWYA